VCDASLDAPSKLAGEKADRGASASSSTPKKALRQYDAVCCELLQKCGFSPVHWSGVSQPCPAARTRSDLCSSSGGRAGEDVLERDDVRLHAEHLGDVP